MSRQEEDAVELADPPFTHHAPSWWGKRMMIFIEGIAVTILAVSYFYIRSTVDSWPPTQAHLPDMGVPSLNLLLISAGAAPFWNAARLAGRQTRPRIVGGWLVLGVLFGISAIVLRGYEFAALHTRYDSSEYGAITWTILAVHLAHLLAATLETSLTALAMFIGPAERKQYTDVAAMAVYWYFIAFSWIALYAIVFISPRFI